MQPHTTRPGWMPHPAITAASRHFVDQAAQRVRRFATVAAEHRAAGNADMAARADRFAAHAFAEAVGLCLSADGLRVAWGDRAANQHRPGVTLHSGHFIETRPGSRRTTIALDGQTVRHITNLQGSTDPVYVAAVIYLAAESSGITTPAGLEPPEGSR